MTDKGPNDLEETINQLNKQKEFLQFQCRKAGRAIIELNIKNEELIKEIDRLSEERDNFKRIYESK
jgi:hypothetical protein